MEVIITILATIPVYHHFQEVTFYFLLPRDLYPILYIVFHRNCINWLRIWNDQAKQSLFSKWKGIFLYELFLLVSLEAMNEKQHQPMRVAAYFNTGPNLDGRICGFLYIRMIFVALQGCLWHKTFLGNKIVWYGSLKMFIYIYVKGLIQHISLGNRRFEKCVWQTKVCGRL